MTTMIVLPKPPSVNALFRNVPGKGRVKTGHYNEWLTAAGWEIKRQRPSHVPGPYALDIFIPPGRGDPDNVIKPVSDLLVKMEVIEDDKHARRASVEVVESLTEVHCIVRPWSDVGRISDQFAFPVRVR